MLHGARWSLRERHQARATKFTRRLKKRKTIKQIDTLGVCTGEKEEEIEEDDGHEEMEDGETDNGKDDEIGV